MTSGGAEEQKEDEEAEPASRERKVGRRKDDIRITLN